MPFSSAYGAFQNNDLWGSMGQEEANMDAFKLELLGKSSAADTFGKGDWAALSMPDFPDLPGVPRMPSPADTNMAAFRKQLYGSSDKTKLEKQVEKEKRPSAKPPAPPPAMPHLPLPTFFNLF